MSLADTMLPQPDPLSQQEWVQVREHLALKARLLHLAGGTFAQIANVPSLRHLKLRRRVTGNALLTLTNPTFT